MMDCLFCKIAQGEKEADVVYEDSGFVAFKDIEPKAPTHLLIVPKQHLTSLKQAKPEHQELLGGMLLTAKKIAAEREAEGYKLVMNVDKEGGQFVEHIHIHLLIGKPEQWP